MNFQLEEILDNIRIVDEERQYWFIRTYSGALYDEFLERNYIGIGMNNIPHALIIGAASGSEKELASLKMTLASQYELPLSEVTRWANQLLTFESSIQIGDIVIIPSENSEEFSFGIVETEIKKTTTERTFKFRDRQEPYPERRKGVRWLKTIEKDDLGGDLRNLSSSRMPILNANKYGETIEGYLSTVYIRDGKVYLTLKIDQDEDINAFAFNDFLSGLTFFYSEFCKENGEEYNEELFLKIKVQSKGKFALKCISVFAGVCLTGVIILSDNPSFKLNLLHLVTLEGKSGGFEKSISHFLDANLERKMKYEKFQDSLARLKAKPFDDSVGKNQDDSADKTITLGTREQTTIVIEDKPEEKLHSGNNKKIEPGSGGKKDQ